MSSRHSQRGLALITAILVVTIVATVTTFLSLGQQVWLRQTQNLVDRSTGNAMRHAALEWVGVLLARDAKNSQTDNLSEQWAKPLPPLPFEGGTMNVVISDAQGRFNLNNVVRNGQPSVADIGVFQQLLRNLSLSPTLTDALVDWIDADSQTRPGGAEDTEYLAQSNPYRTANQPLASVDELRLIKGFDAETVNKLRPYVVALPEATAININTAPDMVLAALYPGMALGTAQQLARQRDAQPFTDINQIAQRLPANTRPAQAALAVASGYFLIQVDIGIGRWRGSSLALFRRTADRKQSRVLWHHPLYPELPKNEDSENKS